MNTKCHSERAESKYLLNFVWHIFLCYTVFDSLGNSPRPLSEEVHSLLPNPEFKKLLSLFGFAGVFGKEFGVDLSTDFRLTEEDNRGLGSVVIIGSLIYFNRNDNTKVENQFDFFMADPSEGLTQAGMAINSVD